MKLIYNKKINEIEYNFYSGFNYEKMNNHCKDGSEGFMYIFIDDWETEKKKIDRIYKIDSLYSENVKNIDDLNNSFIIIYQCSGLKHKDMAKTILKKLQLPQYFNI